jgi:hypothetical protein
VRPDTNGFVYCVCLCLCLCLCVCVFPSVFHLYRLLYAKTFASGVHPHGLACKRGSVLGGLHLKSALTYGKGPLGSERYRRHL